MRIPIVIKITLIFLCIIMFCYSAISRHGGESYNISVDLGSPLSIVWPFEVAVVDDKGEKGLRIGPKIGRGWKGEAGGEASYRFYIPQSGKYEIWAYCWWFDVCSNAVFARIDGMEKAVLGNDPIYNQWHWVRGFSLNLERGTHTLILSNHSDHIALQKILFTNSAFVKPDDCKIVFSDVFYDGFDGCDRGNFANWQIVNGEWLVRNPDDDTCLVENSLIGKSIDRGFIFYNGANWSDYSLVARTKLLSFEGYNNTISICFGVKDPNEYYQLNIKPSKGKHQAQIEISRRMRGRIQLIEASEVLWEQDVWRQIEICLNKNDIAVKIDGVNSVKASINYPITGGIGLSLEGKTIACFDDIHVRQIMAKPI
jgi:hypothetical protein